MPAMASRRSVLVKVRRGVAAGRVGLGAGRAAGLTLTPLFSSIRPTAGQAGLAAPAEWHIATPEGDGAQTSPWDLCHAILRHVNVQSHSPM